MAAPPAPKTQPAGKFPPPLGERTNPSRIDRTGDGTGSRIVLGKVLGRTLAYVSDEDDEAIHVIDVAARSEIGAFALGSAPAQMLITKSGRLVVALREVSSVVVLDATSSKEPLVATRVITTATEPLALAVSPDDATLLVAGGSSHSLEAFRLDTGERQLALSVPPEPRAVVVSDNGKKAYVGHATSSDLTTVDLESANVGGLDLRRTPTSAHLGYDDCAPRAAQRSVAFDDHYPERLSRQVFALVHLPRDPSDKASLTARERILVPSTKVASGPRNATSIGYGKDTHTTLFDVDVIDVKDESVVSKEGGSDVAIEMRGAAHTSCLFPRAAVTHGSRRTLYVACLGVDSVLEFQGGDRSAIATSARKWKVPSGPMGLASDNESNQLIAWSQFDRALSFISLERKAKEPEVITLKRASNTGAVASEDAIRGSCAIFRQRRQARLERRSRVRKLSHRWTRRRPRVVVARWAPPNRTSCRARRQRSVRLARRECHARGTCKREYQATQRNRLAT